MRHAGADSNLNNTERILILAPSPSDASLCERFLCQAQLQPYICADTAALCCAGIDRHLVKPVAMPELEAAIAGR